MTTYKVILFYRYVPIENTEQLREELIEKCQELDLLGRILLAHEGINGTLSGSQESVDTFVLFMIADERFASIDWKDSFGTGTLPFPALSVKIVPEIVSSGSRGKELESLLHYDPNTFGGLAETGKHLTPQEFHEGLADPNCIVLDIRNQFEYDIGHFEKAVNIETYTFAETFDKLDSILHIPQSSAKKVDHDTALEASCAESSIEDDKKVFMYCTGGVRCEKASAYLRSRGFDNVYHLQGGIHRYLQAYPDGGKFEGKNFVFDSRIAMNPDGESPTNPNKIVGHCIDCNSDFDHYSGNIVCTVCRQPVLVCDTCVRENPYPNEYYCARHRELKGIYLTILDNKSLEALLQQRQSLQHHLNLSLKLAQEKKAQKLRDRQMRSRLRHQEELRKIREAEVNNLAVDAINEQSESRISEEQTILGHSEAGESLLENDNTNSEDVIGNENKHRRDTLRKQIQRLDERIQQLEAAHTNQLVSDPNLPNPKARCGFGFWNS